MQSTKNLLLINANGDDRTQLREILEPLNLEILEAASGQEAVDVLLEAEVDLIVTGASIGDFDCWRLTRFVRHCIVQEGRTLPIIIISRDWCERITASTAQEFGVNHYLSFEDLHKLPEAVANCIDSPSVELRKKRILVVEDHKDNALMIEKILSSHFEIELTYDGKEGLDAWKQGRHDLVLLDIMLPKYSGGTVLGQILKINPYQPVVMMTAFATIDVAKNLLLDGATDFITKPFRPQELRKICDLAVRREDYLISHSQLKSRLDKYKHLNLFLDGIVDVLPSPVIGVDRKGMIIYWNQQAESMSEICADYALGKFLINVWPEIYQTSGLKTALRQGKVLNKTHEEYQAADRIRYFDITTYPVIDEEIIGALVKIDIAT